MGSNVTKQRKPTGGPPQRKSALKNRHGRVLPNDRPENAYGEPFGTDLFRPDIEQQPATLASLNERTYPSPRIERPGERPVQRVHYEDQNDLPDNRDSVVPRNDQYRRNEGTSPWINDRPWPADDRYMDRNVDHSPRHYRSHMAYDRPYQPRMPVGRPYRQQGPYNYPYHMLPPQIYPVRQPGLRTLPYYGPIYRSPVPAHERYRPAPVYYNSPRAIPRDVPPDKPPPYRALQPMSYRSNPQHIPPAEISVPNQNGDQEGGITDRSAVQYEGTHGGRYSDREKYEVPTLLTDSTQPAKNLKPKSEESIHEKDDDEYIGANLRFYRNQMKFRPNGEFIDYIHKYWYSNYTLLDKLHTYIQWLFPLYDSSKVNPEAVPLRAHEAKHIAEDAETQQRFLTSFLMMLDFYGFTMTDEETGKIERAANWKDRFPYLKLSFHNHTRITRILKSLGELGHSKLQSPFVMALFHEVFETKELAGISPATINHWLCAITDEFEREYVYKQFKAGINRLDEERKKLKRKDHTKYYFEGPKPLMQKDEHFQFTTRKKPRI